MSLASSDTFINFYKEKKMSLKLLNANGTASVAFHKDDNKIELHGMYGDNNIICIKTKNGKSDEIEKVISNCLGSAREGSEDMPRWMCNAWMQIIVLDALIKKKYLV